MVTFDYKGTQQYGKTIAMDTRTLVLLSRDGRAYDFQRRHCSEITQLKNTFVPLSHSEMRSALLAEHGHRFQVTRSRNYLVVHSGNDGEQWAERFESIYRSVFSYISTRGFDPHSPAFRLVAVVQPGRARFEAYSRKLGVQLPEEVVGYYHPMSNRIVVLDQSAADGTSETWETNAITIIHEAAHQVAHNIGAHSRFGDTPSWVVEGFGTMFEASGVWNARNESTQSSRVNRYQMAMFRRMILDEDKSGWAMRIVANDELFTEDRLAAYAAAWAMTFYLSENRSADYYEYLHELSELEGMRFYVTSRRVADFEKHFGDDWRMLESRVKNFISKL